MSATIAPLNRTSQQRLDALARANHTRYARARLKRLMRARLVDVTVLIANPPDYLATMRVAALLCAMPQYGESRVRRLMLAAGVSDSKTLAGLSPRQRAALVGELESRAERSPAPVVDTEEARTEAPAQTADAPSGKAESQ